MLLDEGGLQTMRKNYFFFETVNSVPPENCPPRPADQIQPWKITRQRITPERIASQNFTLSWKIAPDATYTYFPETGK